MFYPEASCSDHATVEDVAATIKGGKENHREGMKKGKLSLLYLMPNRVQEI